MKPARSGTPEIARVETGVRNLDALIRGGLPEGSVSIIAGPPGSGKTVLSQQIKSMLSAITSNG